MKEIKMGDQIWSAENLDIDIMHDGKLIREISTDAEWHDAFKIKQPAFFQSNQGKIYNYHALSGFIGYDYDRWRIPTIKDWAKLVDFLGAEEIAGYKLKHNFGWSDRSYTWKKDVICLNCISWNVDYRSKAPCHVCKDSRKIVIEHNGNGSNEVGFNAVPGCIVGGKPRGNKPFVQKGTAQWWIGGGFTFDAWQPFDGYDNGDKIILHLSRLLEIFGYPGRSPSAIISQDTNLSFVDTSKENGAAIRLIKM